MCLSHVPLFFPGTFQSHCSVETRPHWQHLGALRLPVHTIPVMPSAVLNGVQGIASPCPVVAHHCFEQVLSDFFAGKLYPYGAFMVRHTISLRPINLHG